MVLCGVSPMNSLCSSGMNDTVDEGFLLYCMHVRKGQLKPGLVASIKLTILTNLIFSPYKYCPKLLFKYIVIGSMYCFILPQNVASKSKSQFTA